MPFYVGRVVREFGDNPKESIQINLPEYIDGKSKIVKSITGELIWNYGDGISMVNTPYSQGVSGFLGKAGKLEFGDITIECKNEYGSIQVVSDFLCAYCKPFASQGLDRL